MWKWANWIDFTDMILVGMLYVFWQWSMSIPVQPNYIPQNDQSVQYPVVQSEVFPRKTLELFVMPGFALFNIILFIIQKIIPKQIKGFNIMPAIWTEIACVCISGIITDVAKSYVGWPRPTMMTKCGIGNNYTTCRVNGSKRDKEFISWPSAHACTAMSSSAFMAFFTSQLFNGSGVVYALIPSGFIFFAVYVGGSRIKDHKHHPADVASGFLIGFIISLIFWISSKEKIMKTPENVIKNNDDIDIAIGENDELLE